MTTPLDRAKRRFARIATLGEAQAVLHWDASAMMPPGGAAARGEQLAVVAGLAHELLIDPATADDLAAADAGDNPWETENLALMRNAQARAAALPVALVEAKERVNAACETVWRVAKAQSDFAIVLAPLEAVVRIQREIAQALSGVTGLSPYDSLMDGYQRGVTAAEVEPVFSAYEAWLRDALPGAEERQARAGAAAPLPGQYPAAAQRALCGRVANRLGLEPAHHRLDESLHPFCGGTPTDVRITTSYDEGNVAKALLGIIHETGHALYERGLPERWARLPVGEAAGMAAHESQSLLVEMQAARSDAYLGWLGAELRAVFGGEGWDAANLVRHWRRVERGFIRVDADEMTYPAHVILRFRLERALIGGELDVADLPGAWAEGLRGLLGIVPPDDARGCLQDIHWHDGAFGYFPSYTLGAMAAAQLMRAAREAVPTLDAELGDGRIDGLRNWLRTNVHGQGSRLGFQDLLRHATGKPLDPSDFTAHLTARYLGA